MTFANPARKNQAFTLVELLVVIAVITILARLLMPGIQGARQKAYAAVCVSNMRQLGIAFNVYGHDSKYYPGASCASSTKGGSDWVRSVGNPVGGGNTMPWSCSPKSNPDPNKWTAIGTYANPSDRPCKKTVFWCPSDRLTTYNNAPWVISYGMTGLHIPECSCTYPFTKYDSVRNPAGTYLLNEEACGESLYKTGGVDSGCNDAESAWACSLSTASSRHNGGSHVLFCDGHVTWAKKSKIDLDIANDDGILPDGSSGDATTY